jgi:hypothetical protein
VAPSTAAAVLNNKVAARREANLPTPEEKYYDGMNTLLAPVRLAKSLVQTVLLIGIAILIAVGYPLILIANHMPIDFSDIVVPFMTILTIFTFCYAPYYFLFGGAVFAVVWATAVIQIDDFPKSLGANEAYGFIFLAVGILQRYIRRRAKAAKEPPKPEYQDIWAQLDHGIFEKLTREYDAMDGEVRNSMISLHGSNYRLWPRPWPMRTSDVAPEDADELSSTESVCENCNKAFGILDLPLGASDEEVNSKKRAFAELFHDDRLGAMSETARRIANEQHQSVNEACSHILTCSVRAKLKGDINGSEPPPAPHQSTCEAMAGGKTDRRPAPATSSGGSEIETRERGHKVLTEQERIDALDATRRKVDETTNEIRDFLEQMKKQKQASLERL